MKHKLSFLFILCAMTVTGVVAQDIPAGDTVVQETVIQETTPEVQAATQPAPQAKPKNRLIKAGNPSKV